MHQQLLAVKRLQCAFVVMVGVVHFALNQSINAKDNRVIMVERVNQAPDGFVAPVHKVFLDPIVA